MNKTSSMGKRIHDFIWDIYRVMQRHYVTFQFLMWLKRRGVMRKISFFVGQLKSSGGRPLEEMQKSRDYFIANAERVERVLSMMADEKSKTVLGGGNSLQNNRCSVRTAALF